MRKRENPAVGSGVGISRYQRIVWLVFVGVLSAVTALGQQITFSGSVWGTPAENYVRPVSVWTFLHFLLAFVVLNLLAVLCLSANYLCQTRTADGTGAAKSTPFAGIKLFFLNFAVLALAWLPYYLSCLPGGVYSDTFANIEQAYAMDELGWHALNNHHPVLYTLLWRVAVLCGRMFSLNRFGTIVLFFTAQYVLMAGILAYLLYWTWAHGLRRKGMFVLLGFVALFPLFPLYAVSLWKDTPFSLLLLLFSLFVGEYALEKDSAALLHSPKYLLKIMLAGLLVCFLRNNGKYIVFFMLLLLVLLNVKRIFLCKKFVLLTVALVLTVQIIQGPVYDSMNYNVVQTLESLGIPLQQMAYLAYYDYDLTAEELEYIDSICPIASIKENFIPCIFDALKWYTPGFDITVVERDKLLFLKRYAGMMIKHPVGGIRSFMMETAGFWAPGVASRQDAYVQNFVWRNTMDIEGYDFLQEKFGFTIQEPISKMKPISSAVFLFALFYAAFVLIWNRDYKKLLLLLPAFLNWGTIMVATPVACSLRYVYVLVLMLPVEVCLVCVSEKRG